MLGSIQDSCHTLLIHLEFLEKKSLRTPAHPRSQSWNVPQWDNPGVVLEIGKPVHTVFPDYQEELSCPQTSPSTPGSCRAKRGTRRDTGCWPPSLCPFQLPFGGLSLCIARYCLVGWRDCPRPPMAWFLGPLSSPLNISDKPTTAQSKPDLVLLLPSFQATVSSILSCCFGQMHWFPINKTKRKGKQRSES